LFEGESKAGAALGGRHLGYGVPGIQMDAVIARLGLFVFVAEFRGALIFVHDEFAGHGHEGKSGVVADPGTGLVGLANAAYTGLTVLIIEGILGGLSVWRQVFIGNGKAMAGYSLPCEKPTTESVPWSGLANMTGGVPAEATACNEKQASNSAKRVQQFGVSLIRFIVQLVVT